MKEKVLLITKDALCKTYLPIYGNTYWKMPNLEDLAMKGTVYDKYYTAAPSTAMAFISMFTGKYPYKTAHRKYVPTADMEKDTLFDKLYKEGFSCHIIWDERWVYMAKRYSECYGEHTTFHYVKMNQKVGSAHYYSEELKNDDNLAQRTLNAIDNEIKDIVNNNNKLFLWIHIPHVLLGRTGYGTDMDIFDKIIGIGRHYFEDDSITISADHGNMNGVKGKICYGFDVYEPAISIPLITPKISNVERSDQLLSNIHLREILEGRLPSDEFILSDCAYYAQPRRKLAIIHNNFKYIYNKRAKTEELYDLKNDPNENCNLLNPIIYDVDRKVKSRLKELYFYPYWNEAQEEYKTMKKIFNDVWRTESLYERFMAKAHQIGVLVQNRINQLKNINK